MRNLSSYTETEAEMELRTGEYLIPSGGITIGTHEINFFSAANDEDFMTNEHKKEHRRQVRKDKRKNKWSGI